MSNQIEQIRAEIERLIKHNAEHPKDEITADVYEYALQDVLEILDKYEQAHPVPSDVQEDKAAMDYYLNLPNSSYGEGGNLLPRSINDAFKAGAEWQRSKYITEDVKKAALNYERSLDYYHFVNDEPGIAYAAGMLAERERLTKGAVEAELWRHNGRTLRVSAVLPANSPIRLGDKVSVIIIKKENEK